MKGVLLWLGFVGLDVPVKEIFVQPFGCSSRPNSKYNIFFLTKHYFNAFDPVAQQAGQTAVLGCMSLSMCLWCILYTNACLKKASMWYRKSIKHYLTINHPQKRCKHISSHLLSGPVPAIFFFGSRRLLTNLKVEVIAN
jgi:hypothetical protein